MGQFVGAIKGIGAACAALDMPIVSGNVSLYNETDGKGILPTPTIGAVGLLRSLDDLIAGRPAEGDLAVVVGATRGHLGQSALLAEAFGIEAGAPPPVDLEAERRHGDFIRAQRRLLRACSDLGDGGLALAAFEMAEAAGLGLRLDSAEIGFLFGEDQARYLIALPQDRLGALQAAARAAGVPLALVGQFGGATVALGAESAALADLSALYRGAFAASLGLGDLPPSGPLAGAGRAA
jgi:phosphoribosylformylglycinamidine synthase